MTDDLNAKARRVFLALVELPDAKRAAAVVSFCAGNPALRAEVEGMLRAGSAAGAREVAPMSPPAAATSPGKAPAREQSGDRIGNYTLLSQIGEGGMGTIWLAEQREPIKRRVALKVIKRGMDTEQVVARFEAERQALALMDHPNIAKVFDAGATDMGRPYFVMEYIKGVPILEYCDQAKVGTKARLELFTKVCQAIQHAHQKGVIHRDIKPSNVLVTLHDGAPAPKVIDFGVAKATTGELTTRTLFTEHRQMVGTPAYMSPEQADMSGLDIDTRSDIYSLGVLLYELLTGTTPFDIKQLVTKGFAEMMRTIREDEPHKPSTRISSLGDTSARTALLRSIDARQLSSQLRGDIDWIVMKCLEKDRSRRYETANGLAADILRHLRDEPVTAAAPSAGYRLRKFVKRNRGHVLTGVVVAAALVLGVIGTTAAMLRALEERTRADEQTQRATLAAASESRARVEAQQSAADAIAAARRAEAAQAHEAEARQRSDLIAGFMTETLRGVGPSVAMGRDTTMLKELMDATAARIEEGALHSAPEAELTLRATIGRTYQQIAALDDAHEMLQPAVALARAAHAGDHEATCAALGNLGSLQIARGELAGAETLLREALAMRARLVPCDHTQLASDLQQLGHLRKVRGDLAEAESLLREALAMQRRHVPGDHLEVAELVTSLGAVLEERGDKDGAEQCHREALATWQRLHPADHPDVATCLQRLARLLTLRGAHAESEPLLVASLEMRQRLFPGAHPLVLAASAELAEALLQQGKSEPGVRRMRDVLAASRTALPEDSPVLAGWLATLGLHLLGMQSWHEAEPLLREALAIRATARPEEWATFHTMSMLGGALLGQRKLAEAEPLLLDGYRGMKARAASVPRQGAQRIPEALERLVRLHEAFGHASEAAAWRGELDAARAAATDAVMNRGK